MEYKLNFPNELAINARDTMSIPIPKELIQKNSLQFPINDPGGIEIGNAVAKDGEIKVTFNDYFKNHPEDKYMNVELWSEWDKTVVENGGWVDLEIANFKIHVQSGTGVVGAPVDHEKWGNFNEENTEIEWTIKLNEKFEDWENVTLKDFIGSDQELIEGSIEGLIVESFDDYTNHENVTLDMIKVNSDKSGFEINLGNKLNKHGLLLTYRVRVKNLEEGKIYTNGYELSINGKTENGEAEKQYLSSGGSGGGTDHAEAILKAKKILEGRELKAGEFEFILEEVNNSNQVKELQRKKNDASGNVRFDKIEYRQEGVFNYQIREVKGNLENVTYDEKIVKVQVKVEVRDDKWYADIYYGDNLNIPTFENKYEEPKIDIKVTKDWKDSSNNPLQAPVEKIEVELYKDGTVTGIKKELTKANNWTATFENLKVSETLGGKIHKYTVKEVGENNNSIKFGDSWYKVSITGDMKDGFTITNKKLPPLTPMKPPARDIKVTKDWKDISGVVLEAPVEKIEVELYRDGVATGTKKEISKSNNWKVSFDKLPVYESIQNQTPYKYTIKEVGEENTLIQFDGKWYKVSIVGDMATGYTITNKKLPPLTPMEPPTRDIKVTKDWKGTSGVALEAPVEKIEVELYRDGKATGKKLELNKKNNWKASFDKLAVYESIKNQTPYNYTIKEVGEENTLIQFDGKWYKVSIVGDMATGYTITNKKLPPLTPMEPPTRDIKVTKDWKSTSGAALEAPVEKIEVELYRDGKATGKKLELNKKNNWKASFDKLAVYESIKNQTPYKYTIKEVGEQNTLIQFDGKWYKVSIVGDMATGYTITNKRAPSEKPSIPSENVPSEKKYVEIKKLPKTGDSQNLSMYSGIFLILGSLLLAGLKREKL